MASQVEIFGRTAGSRRTRVQRRLMADSARVWITLHASGTVTAIRGRCSSFGPGQSGRCRRSAAIDIVQAAGRAMRKPRGATTKTVGKASAFAGSSSAAIAGSAAGSTNGTSAHRLACPDLFEKTESALQQRAVLLRIVAPTEAAVGQQRLSEFLRTLSSRTYSTPAILPDRPALDQLGMGWCCAAIVHRLSFGAGWERQARSPA